MSLRIRQLDATDFEACRQGLIALLIDAVANGASVGFMADIDAQQASAYFDEVNRLLASGASVSYTHLTLPTTPYV